jgi:DNA-binding MarR family transcriptional regulator
MFRHTIGLESHFSVTRHRTDAPLSLSHEDQIVAAIRQIIRAVDIHSRQLVEVHGLTGPQLAVLQETQRLGPVSQTSLARAVHLSQATVTGILQRLQRRSLVAREPSPEDRRSVIVSITSDGEALLAASPSQLQDRFRDALSSLANWERLQILATMQRVATLMDADTIDAAPHLTPGEIPAVVDRSGC